MLPFCGAGPETYLYPLYTLDPTIPLTDLNINWDHTCNVVVLQPQYYLNGTLITTKQVSEYDSAVRPQIDFNFDPKECNNCWKKVNGGSALDSGNGQSAWNPELNCGDSCLVYTLEEHYVMGEITPPRALVGRSFRTSQVSINITDSIQVQTLSWSPMQEWVSKFNQFIGIGICCTDKWCHPDCIALGSNDLVLFSLLPYNKGEEISILEVIGEFIDQDTIRLGVEFTPIFTPASDLHVFIYYQQSIITYDPVVVNGVITVVKESQRSPRRDRDIVQWASGGPR